MYLRCFPACSRVIGQPPSSNKKYQNKYKPKNKGNQEKSRFLSWSKPVEAHHLDMAGCRAREHLETFPVGLKWKPATDRTVWFGRKCLRKRVWRDIEVSKCRHVIYKGNTTELEIPKYFPRYCAGRFPNDRKASYKSLELIIIKFGPCRICKSGTKTLQT